MRGARTRIGAGAAVRALDELDHVAWMLDSRWRIPGTGLRFGLDAVLGLVPGLGDVAAAAISLYLILRARQLGAPNALLGRMVGNVVIDTVLGSIPLLGSVFDLFYKANNRNMRLLRRHLQAGL